MISDDNFVSVDPVKNAAEKIHEAGGCYATDEYSRGYDDAVLFICGDNDVNLYLLPKRNIFSADYDNRGDLQDYGDCVVEEFAAGALL